MGQERGSLGVKAKALQGCGPRGSQGVTSHTPESVRSVRECEGVNTHTPKATPTLGDGVPVDSQGGRWWLPPSSGHGESYVSELPVAHPSTKGAPTMH